MDTESSRWSLGSKLTLVAAPFLLMALLSTAATLWVSWQLDGGAAAVNEAGRMRMQAYRLALVVDQRESQELAQLVQEFDTSLTLLRTGAPERPLFVPWDEEILAHFSTIELDWRRFQSQWLSQPAAAMSALRTDTVQFTSDIDVFVAGIERHLTRWTAILHLLQIGIVGLAIVGSAVLLLVGYLLVLEPVHHLKQAIQKIQAGDLSARVEAVTSDEFGTLARGFNGMAEHLQAMYRNLERKVQEKTAELEEKRERLESLYEVTALVARATSLDELAQDFAQSIRRIAHADGVAVRWSDQENQRFLMLAASGLPASMMKDEQCLQASDCHCGTPIFNGRLRVIPINTQQPAALRHCAEAGFNTVINVPIRLHGRLMGEVDLLFHAKVSPSEAELSLLEALNSHLASAMENLRLNASGKEAAISEERHLIARELHDSIAQSLAFLKIQVQLMRDALQSNKTEDVQLVLEEIDTGVRECYGDVRELLMHFRTRANAEDIEPALATTLRKFEHQTGLKTELAMAAGHGLPLTADVQIQVLHIVQEALSNVRKHARASQVWLQVQQQPSWRFEVRDNGIGFASDEHPLKEMHVGMRIMVERAQRMDAVLEAISTPLHGTSVILTLPAPKLPAPTHTPATSGMTLAAQTLSIP